MTTTVQIKILTIIALYCFIVNTYSFSSLSRSSQPYHEIACGDGDDSRSSAHKFPCAQGAEAKGDDKEDNQGYDISDPHGLKAHRTLQDDFHLVAFAVGRGGRCRDFNFLFFEF